ncbi:hypothetical protein BSKO_08674 [Bryopsis sp. KO-2023]|nr:hypothetical protein BSKO_08674 [Bryopsis sp. KO-2023]
MADRNTITHELTARWAKEQAVIREKIEYTDDVDWSIDGDNDGDSALKFVGGLDVSFYKDDSKRDKAMAALVVLTYPELKVVFDDYEDIDLEVPYIPGFLAFRECPAFHKLLARVASTEFNPQVLLVDGNGILHPRGCGCASHLGVESRYPTIGVAKNLHCIQGLDEKAIKTEVRRRMSSSNTTGDGIYPLVGSSGSTLGAAVYGHGKGTVVPIYVSTGHRISLELGIELVKKCSLCRIPEPIRQADLRSRRIVRKEEAHGS